MYSKSSPGEKKSAFLPCLEFDSIFVVAFGSARADLTQHFASLYPAKTIALVRILGPWNSRSSPYRRRKSIVLNMKSTLCLPNNPKLIRNFEFTRKQPIEPSLWINYHLVINHYDTKCIERGIFFIETSVLKIYFPVYAYEKKPMKTRLIHISKRISFLTFNVEKWSSFTYIRSFFPPHLGCLNLVLFRNFSFTTHYYCEASAYHVLQSLRKRC